MNPLIPAITAMAIHAACSVALGWPYPSIATALAGFLGMLVALATPGGAPKVPAFLTAGAGLAPETLPPVLAVAGWAALVARVLTSRGSPLFNLVLALGGLAILVLALVP